MSLYDRAACIPGRSLTRSKSPDRFVRIWAEEGDGAEIIDTDGKRYIDMLCALGAVSLGYEERYAHPRLPNGVFSIPHKVEVEAAEAVLQHVAPWASHVRFTKTGSEATHAAYRIAIAAARRKGGSYQKRVLVGDWAYHGWHSWCSDEIDLRYTIRYGHGAPLDCDPMLAASGEIAAVFVEPHRWEPVNKAWLYDLRLFCDRVGALLVFDEMIYGGRWALGGATQYYGVVPDMATFGKGLANGQSCAFVVGCDALAEHGEIASGTYSGDTVGLQAVCDTLQVYASEPVIDTLWERGRQLQMGLQSIAHETGKFIVEGAPVHQRIRSHEPPAKTAYDYRVGDERPFAKKFREGMAERGVLMLPDAVNVMYSHTSAQIDRVLEAVRDTVQTL